MLNDEIRKKKVKKEDTRPFQLFKFKILVIKLEVPYKENSKTQFSTNLTLNDELSPPRRHHHHNNNYYYHSTVVVAAAAATACLGDNCWLGDL